MKYLQKVNPEHYFILKNGFVVSSLPELHETLQQVDDEIISHHLNEHKNDFARWIEHAVGDSILKNRIEDITSKDRFLEELENRIRELQPGMDIGLDVPLEGEMLDAQATETLRNMGLGMDEAPPDVPPDVPPDLPPDTPPPTQKKPEAQQPAQGAPPDTPPQEGSQPAAGDPAPSTPPSEEPANVPPDTPPSTPSQETNQPASDATPNEGKQQPAQDTPSQNTPAQNEEKPKEDDSADTAQEEQPPTDSPPDTAPPDTPPHQEGQPAPDNPPQEGGQQPAQQTDAKEDKSHKQPAQDRAPDTRPQAEKKAEDKPKQTQPTKDGSQGDKKQEGSSADAQKEDTAPHKKVGKEETKETASEGDADKKNQGDNKAAKKESQPPETSKKEDKSGTNKVKKMVADKRDSGDQANDEDVVEIRELTLTRLGLPEIDNIFRRGIPNICNLLFVGTMSTGKTLTALKAILSMARQGKRAMYISFHDSEEKIINVMHSIDSDILKYINAENISIQKLDPFTMGHTCTKEDFDSYEFLQFVEIFSPNLIVVDSLSALELGFPEHKLCYRKFVDDMFKYFEKLGVVTIFIKDLKSKEEVHQEFFENIIADVIVEFERTQKGEKSIKLVKDYPIPQPKKEKKGILSFLRK